MKQKVTLAEGLTIAGTVVTIIGHALYLGNGNQPNAAGLTFPDAVKIVGIAIFMGGVVIALRDFSTQIKGLTTSHDAAYQAMELGESTRRIFALSQWFVKNPRAIHVSGATHIASEMLRKYVPRLLNQIEAFHTDNIDHIDVRVLPVHDLLETLANDLPSGGVWLSHSINPNLQAWYESEHGLDGTLRSRAEAGHITVLKLYGFTTPAELETAKDAIQGITPPPLNTPGSGMHVRGLIVSDSEQDIALLYLPSSTTTLPFSVPAKGKITKSLVDAGFELLCAVELDARPDGLLYGAKIHCPTSPDAKKYPGKIGLLWENARLLERQKISRDT